MIVLHSVCWRVRPVTRNEIMIYFNFYVYNHVTKNWMLVNCVWAQMTYTLHCMSASAWWVGVGSEVLSPLFPYLSTRVHGIQTQLLMSNRLLLLKVNWWILHVISTIETYFTVCVIMLVRFSVLMYFILQGGRKNLRFWGQKSNVYKNKICDRASHRTKNNLQSNHTRRRNKALKNTTRQYTKEISPSQISKTLIKTNPYNIKHV